MSLGPKSRLGTPFGVPGGTRNREKKRFRWPRGVQGTPGSIPRKSSLDPGAVLDRTRAPKGSLRDPLGDPLGVFWVPRGSVLAEKILTKRVSVAFSLRHTIFHQIFKDFGTISRRISRRFPTRNTVKCMSRKLCFFRKFGRTFKILIQEIRSHVNSEKVENTLVFTRYN